LGLIQNFSEKAQFALSGQTLASHNSAADELESCSNPAMQWFPTGVPRHPGVPFTVPRGAAGLPVFYHIIKNTFSNCHQTSKQIAMGSALWVP